VKKSKGFTRLQKGLRPAHLQINNSNGEVSNVEENDEQRGEPKQLGGITGRGFLPGQSDQAQQVSLRN
jgi:hypothetical protein